MPGRNLDPEPARSATDAPESLVPEGCPWPVVVGIDPGTYVAGYAALVLAPEGPRLLLCGVVRAPRSLSVPQRLVLVRDGIEAVLRRCRPQAVVIERAYAARNIQSALRIGEARGVLLASAAAIGAEVVQLTPAEAKRALVGNGQAAKEQVAAMARALLVRGEADLPLDATDAIALAYAHTKRIALSTAMGTPLARGAAPDSNGAANGKR